MIQATDYLFYKDPIFLGEDWVFRDGYMYVKAYKTTTENSARKRITAAKKESGLKFRILRCDGMCRQILKDDNLHDTFVFAVMLTAATPVPRHFIACSAGVPKDLRDVFSLEFWCSDIILVLKGGQNPLLEQFYGEIQHQKLVKKLLNTGHYFYVDPNRKVRLTR